MREPVAATITSSQSGDNMAATYRELADYLVGLGIETVPHTQKNYLAHLIAVYRVMHDAGCDEELCRAGMFHSIYGTERFQGFKLPLDARADLRQRIGERAERLAYLNCAMDRASFDEALSQPGSTRRFRDRITGDMIELDEADFDDLCRVHLFDWLEQAPRSRFGWDYRRDAYRQMAERCGPAARALHAKVYALETGVG
jgi:hypothetical protein